MEIEDSVPYWKRIWQSATVLNDNVQELQIVSDVLDILGKHVNDGLTVFKAFEPEDFETESKNKHIRDNIYFKNFFKRLCQKLNLNPTIGWSIFCSYLLYEFYGKLSDVQVKILYEVHINRIIEDIWQFYTSERTFFLKVVKYVLKHHKDENNRYCKVYKEFVDKIGVLAIFESLLMQHEYLIHEIDSSHSENCLDLHTWIKRNKREQIEVILCMVYVMEYDEFTVEHFQKMFKVFSKHYFAFSPLYIDTLSIEPVALINVFHAEIGAVLVGMQKWWTNVNYWLPYSKEIKEAFLDMRKDIPLLYEIWVTLMSTVDSSTSLRSKQQLHSLEENVLPILHAMAKNPIFASSSSGDIILYSIFIFYNRLYVRCDYNNVLCYYPGAIPLFEELLKREVVVKELFSVDKLHPLKQMYDFVVKLFPVDFFSLTSFTTAMIKHKNYAEKVLQFLLCLNTYAEECSNELSETESVVLSADYYPIAESKSLVLRKGTEAVGFSLERKKFAIFKAKYSYFDILSQQVDSLSIEIRSRMNLPEMKLEKVIAGYNLLSSVFKKCPSHLVKDVSHCLRNLDIISMTFTDQSYGKNYELFKMFFKVYVAIATTNTTIKMNILDSHIFPKLKKREVVVKDLYEDNIVEPSLLAEYLRIEATTNNHELLLVYFDLLKHALDNDIRSAEIQIPFVVYMVRNVIHRHWEWEYANPLEKYQISNECLQVLLKILSKNSDDRLIYDFCLHNSLNNKNVITGFMNVLSLSNFMVQKEIEGEIDWDNGPSFILIKNVKILFTIFLILIKKYDRKNEPLSVFERRLLYSKLHHAAPIKIVTGFVNHTFDPSVQTLSVRVLQMVAAECKEPLMGPLDLDEDQFRCLFFDKLRDPIENDNLRIAIIEFINSCVENQPGLTATLFEINKLRSKTLDARGAGNLADILIDYLQNITKSPETLHSPLQSGILEIIYKLWRNGQSSLIDDITKLKSFWTLLIDPLFHKITISNRLYCLIIGIINMELVIHKEETSVNLKEVLTTFFDSEKEHLSRWIQHLTEISKNDTLSSPNEIWLIHSWRYFTMLVNKFMPDCFKETEVRLMLIDLTLKGLLTHFESPKDVRVIRAWAENHLIYLAHWGDNLCAIKPEETFDKLTKILNYLVGLYPLIDSNCKKTFLAITSKILTLLKPYIDENPNVLYDILVPLGRMMDLEFKTVDYYKVQKQESSEVENYLANWVLVLSICKTLLQLKEIVHHAYWFHTYEFLKRTLYHVALFMRDPNTLPIAKLAVQGLLMYAESPMAKDFLKVEMSQFLADVMPIPSYIDRSNINSKTISVMREWWITVGEIIKLYVTLLEKFNIRIMKECFLFTYLLDDILINTIELPEFTIDPAALSSACLCLQFVNVILRWKKFWIMENVMSFNRVMNSIQKSLNTLLAIILRPSCMTFYTIEEKPQIIPNDRVEEDAFVEIYNKLMQMVALCLFNFTMVCPRMLDLFEYYAPKRTPFEIELDFTVPKPDRLQGVSSTLTYGGLICLLQFLCKTLRKLSLRDRKRTSSTNTPTVTADEQRPNTLTEAAKIKKLQSFIGLVVYDYYEYLPSERILASAEFSFLQVPWLRHINQNVLKTCVELLTTFMAMHLYLCLANKKSLSTSLEVFLKRELYAELNFYKEFVEKCMHEKYRNVQFSPVRGVKTYNDLLRQCKFNSKLLSKSDKDYNFQEEYWYGMLHWFYNICSLGSNS